MYDIAEFNKIFGNSFALVKSNLIELLNRGIIDKKEFLNLYSGRFDIVLQTTNNAVLTVPTNEASINEINARTNVLLEDVRLKKKEAVMMNREMCLKEKDSANIINARNRESSRADKLNAKQLLEIDEKIKNLKKDLDVKQKNIELMNRQMEKINSEIATEANLRGMRTVQSAEIQAESNRRNCKNSAECDLLKAEKTLKEKQASLTDRQKDGFNQNIRIKMVQAQLEAWGLTFSSGINTNVPSCVSNDSVTSVWNALNGSL